MSEGIKGEGEKKGRREWENGMNQLIPKFFNPSITKSPNQTITQSSNN
ncbi:MAG: hypothetical protein KAR38_17105 [Calditrichia bacterium]|nr:hypothetical protein [Calditrichia bacterium]